MSISVKEAAERLDISIRAVQHRCKRDKIRKKDNTYLIPLDTLETWRAEAEQERITKRQNEANERSEAEIITESFSQEQYDKLQEVIFNYPQLLERITDYKNEIDYLRKSLDSKSQQMEMLIHTMNDSIKSIQQQNYLSAKEKGYDKE